MNEKIRRAFDQVHAEDELKDSTLRFIREERLRRQRPGRRYLRPLAAALACLALVVAWALYLKPAAAVSVDINPSVEMGVNVYGRVISVEAMNSDGQALLSGLSLRNKSYTDAVEELISSPAMEPYLEADGLVSVTVVSGSERRGGRMLNMLQRCTGQYGQQVYCCSGRSEDVQTAHELGMSFGKYQAYLQLKALDDSVTPEQVQGMSMREIWDAISQLGSEASCGGGQQRGRGRNSA